MRHESTLLTTRCQDLKKHTWEWALLVLLAVPHLLRAQAPVPRPVQSKLAPGLQTPDNQSPTRTVRVSVADKAAFQRWMQQHLPAARISQPTASTHTLTVAGLSPAALAQLAASPLVDFVDEPRLVQRIRVSW